MILVVDANFLMSAFRFKVDAISGLRDLVGGDFRLVTSSSVIRELEGIAGGKNLSARGARFALETLKREGAQVDRTEKYADDWVLEYCVTQGAVACTNDAELRKRLREAGIRSIVLKGRSKIDYA